MKMHTEEKKNKCDQCSVVLDGASKDAQSPSFTLLLLLNFASSWAGNLWTHLKTHSGEKSNKCNQCDYASSKL